MIEISEHAREEMEDDGITEDEVEECLEHGELEIKQIVKGEMRYGKKRELKDKTIIMIYTYKEGIQRVITGYTVRRKRWQNR